MPLKVTTFIKLFLTSIVLMSTGASATADPWVQIKGQPPALGIDETPFSTQLTEYLSFKHENGSRSDWIISGTLAQQRPNLTMFVSWQADPKPIRYSLIRNLEDFSDLKRLQLRYRHHYYAMTTRFGELRGVVFDVNGDGVRKTCVGFHKPESNAVFLKGFACSTNDVANTPEKVACLIDRVRYTKSIDEESLTKRLAQGEAQPCGAVRLDPQNSAPVPDSRDML